MKIELADVDGNSMARELLPYRLQEKQQIIVDTGRSGIKR